MRIHGDRFGRLVELSPLRELRPPARLLYTALIGWLVMTGVILVVVRLAATVSTVSHL